MSRYKILDQHGLNFVTCKEVGLRGHIHPRKPTMNTLFKK